MPCGGDASSGGAEFSAIRRLAAATRAPEAEARVPGAVTPRRFAFALVLAAALIGCGGSDDDAATTPKATQTAPAAAAAQKPRGTSDRGARRCSKAAFLAALLADVAPQAFKVDQVRCAGDFGRSRFVNAGCSAQPAGIACDGAKVAAWRLGAKRWRLIAYADGLKCGEVRKKAGDFPSSLCD